MKRGQINTIIVALLIAGGVIINLYRFFPSLGVQKPEFEVFDVRTFDELEPMTIVHYQIRNVGELTAHEVLTSVYFFDENNTLPAYFSTLSKGEAVSVNRKIPPGQYSEIKIGIFSSELEETKYHIVSPNINPEPPPEPDFIAYNLTTTSRQDENQTQTAAFWLMNIGGKAGHDVKISIHETIEIAVDMISPGYSEMITFKATTTPEGLDVKISCKEGITQTYFLEEYKKH